MAVHRRHEEGGANAAPRTQNRGSENRQPEVSKERDRSIGGAFELESDSEEIGFPSPPNRTQVWSTP